ncbi:hypothetical protein GLAREA_12629 [Glarea lozoyensis ATCC 20868]|uniref:Metalloproteases (Zincins), catalytic n=1 Tax=Glarea lozoyensis (strain ATCC 20868 / MF5171) TaxID=1116229 RepID=S3DH40_GLAL2|nr:uncharacterized protein GLAREA_12629 [Glarea lozoyensis ATCC 20868]EPE31326.1 hypothetical protein GLAREA_12629 [Glarea lozoyensis ATCC 20868]
MRYQALLFVPFFFWLSNAVELTDLFFDRGAGPGSCRPPQDEIVKSWLRDTVTLVDSTLAALGGAINNDKALKRNLNAWFGIKVKATDMDPVEADRLDTVTRSVQSVKDFLEMRNPSLKEPQIDGSGGKPWLFCNSDWQHETELMFDGDLGLPIYAADGVTQGNLRTWPIPDNANPADPFIDILLKMRQGSAPDWAHYAYWSPDIRDYVIEKASARYPGNPPSWCNGQDMTPEEQRFGLTSVSQLRDTITICPDAFDEAKSEPFETIDLTFASAAARSVRMDLEKTAPRSLTLFHELIHLTSGVENTPDVGTKPTECLKNRLRKLDMSRNPDSIVFFAWSYYLENNGPEPKFSWHSGKSAARLAQ